MRFSACCADDSNLGSLPKYSSAKASLVFRLDRDFLHFRNYSYTDSGEILQKAIQTGSFLPRYSRIIWEAFFFETMYNVSQKTPSSHYLCISQSKMIWFLKFLVRRIEKTIDINRRTLVYHTWKCHHITLWNADLLLHDQSYLILCQIR